MQKSPAESRAVIQSDEKHAGARPPREYGIPSCAIRCETAIKKAPQKQGFFYPGTTAPLSAKPDTSGQFGKSPGERNHHSHYFNDIFSSVSPVVFPDMKKRTLPSVSINPQSGAPVTFRPSKQTPFREPGQQRHDSFPVTDSRTPPAPFARHATPPPHLQSDSPADIRRQTVHATIDRFHRRPIESGLEPLFIVIIIPRSPLAAIRCHRGHSETRPPLPRPVVPFFKKRICLFHFHLHSPTIPIAYPVCPVQEDPGRNLLFRTDYSQAINGLP